MSYCGSREKKTEKNFVTMLKTILPSLSRATINKSINQSMHLFQVENPYNTEGQVETETAKQ